MFSILDLSLLAYVCRMYIKVQGGCARKLDGDVIIRSLNGNENY